MKYVYGSKKFVKMIKRACGEVKVLENIEDVWKIPQGAVLYTDAPLHVAAKMKMKVPWVTVRSGIFEIEDVKLKQLDVYELLREIGAWGCAVYVPDVTVRRALEVLSMPIVFEERCQSAYPCPDLWLYGYDFYQVRNEVPPIVEVDKKILDMGVHVKTMAAPTNLTTSPGEKTCTAIGTPYIDIDWSYYIDYPLGLSPSELATLLREKKLKFQKLVPKMKHLENLCR
jgi:hypothetical protein